METSEVTTYAKLLKEDMMEAGLTQEELAKRVGAKQQTVSGWTKGRSVPRPAYQEKLEAVFGKFCRISTIPKSGLVRVLTDIRNKHIEPEDIEPVRYSRRETPGTGLSAHAQEIGEMFDMLPADKLTRVAAHRECTGLLLSLLDDAAKRKASEAALLEHKP